MLIAWKHLRSGCRWGSVVALPLLVACNQSSSKDSNQSGGSSAATSNTQDKSSLDLSKLCRHWKHSYEEQPQGSLDLIFRTKEFAFPPSRFRMAYILEKDHTCQWYYLSPDDEHRFKPGRWSEVAGEPNVIEIYEPEKHRFQIVELTDDRLVMRSTNM